MKRLRDGPYSSSALEKKALLRDTILSLTASQSDVGQNSRQSDIRPTQKPKEVQFLHRIHRLLIGGKTRIHGPRFPETMLIGSEFKENAAKLMEWLKSSEACVFGVWGMGGVGKTALLKHIYHKLKRDHTFHFDVHWLTVSEAQCDDVNWQLSVAKCFGLDLSNEADEMKRKYKLYEAFGRRNTLLILDNVWQPFQAAEIGIPLGESGCKIILTTRSLEVCRLMGCKVVNVHTLSDWESKVLFEEKIENYDTLTEEVKGVARKIVGRCKGLPLAIITMASHMRGVVDINEWNYTLHELDICEQGDMNEKVFPRLQCSLDQLNDETLQKCFLSSLFYFQISIIDIIRKDWLVDRWNKEGLLDNKTERYPMMPMRLAKGLAIIKKLVSLCLLSEFKYVDEDEDDDVDEDDDDYDYIKMHGLIRDMGIRFNHKVNQCFMTKRSHSIQYGEVPDNELWSEDLVRVSLCSNGIHQIPCEMSPKCPKLIVLNLSGNPFAEIPGSFFVNMEALTVLDLSKTGIVSLPDSVCQLKNLRTLLLSGCEELTHVPSLTMLTKLRVLDLFGAFKIDALMVVENLKSLEMLNFSWRTSDLLCVNRLMTSKAFTSFLEEYKLQIYDEVRFRLWPSCKRSVEICMLKFDDEKVISLPCNIEGLLVKECHIKNLADGFPSLNETMLKRLELCGCGGMEYIFSANQQVPPIFPSPKSPQKLIIECLPDLRGIIKFQGDETPQSAYAFSNLTDLSIDGCPKMGSVFPIKLVQQSFRFTNLQKVKVAFCEGLEEIFESINNDIGAASNYNLVLPNLRVLTLVKLPKLGSIHWGQVYTSLRELYIYACVEMEVVFELPNDGAKVLTLPNLDHLSLIGLPELKSIYRGLLLCPSIQTIDIRYCLNYRGMELSKQLICDESPRTLAALPPYNPNGDFWGPLIRDYPDDARILRGVVDEYQRSKQTWEPSSGPAPEVANQAFAPPADMWMNQNATQGPPQTELSLSAWVPAHVYDAGPEVESSFFYDPWHNHTLNDPGPSSSSRQDPNMPWDGQHTTDL